MLRVAICVISLAAVLSVTPSALTVKLGPGRSYSTIERLNPERLAAVKQDRMQYQQSRRSLAGLPGYRDYRAILHAHAEDAAHTGGTRPELLADAKKSGVNIIMLTDHVRPPRDFIKDSWRGIREGVLFIPGAESEGFLAYPQRSIIDAYLNKSFKDWKQYLSLVKQDGGTIFLSHVEERLDWDTTGMDGLEIYNLHTDVMDESEFMLWLRGSLTDPDRLRLIEKLIAEYPQEVFGSLQDYLAPIVAKWDTDLQSRKLTGVSANDCHHNQVFTVKAVDSQTIEIGIIGDPPRKVTTAQVPKIAPMLTGKKPGEIIAKLDFDPYERSLSHVSTHVMLRSLDEPSVRQALNHGRAYVAHDWLCDPTGFSFTAQMNGKSNGKMIGTMGDQVKSGNGLTLRIEAPVAGMVKLIHNGRVIAEKLTDKLEHQVTSPGVYRVEIWLQIDGEQRPWIYANPIRVE